MRRLPVAEAYPRGAKLIHHMRRRPVILLSRSCSNLFSNGVARSSHPTTNMATLCHQVLPRIRCLSQINLPVLVGLKGFEQRSKVPDEVGVSGGDI
jgi:hypothetical protein